MRTKFTILLATAGLLLAAGEPGFAAPRPEHPAHAHGAIHEHVITHHSEPASGWSWNGFPADGTAAEPLGPGRNLPYPDRPYGAPDGW